ncbi:prepilin-type N-terminal cleavage/methylation domain-containing protein, partial [Shigella dysenteriae]|nr:prepilin-type N-terminal cleavage/methylation domain-containing protein [Escherichia coli]EFP6927027.1 prepilin-type N-terminal cleavage/methylation domain-containing protein [Shigella dysenteriae]EFP8851920.1 prepilin-type N-terminal cleavage/methylation domain-containing protein [Shigella dysenteriae]
MFIKSKKKLQRGLSLIEASMVLALSAIVVSGVMYYYQSASDNNKTQNTVSELM